MPGGGSNSTGGSPAANMFTWNGGNPGSLGGPIIGLGQSGFDPAQLGKIFGHDIQAGYGQGPKTFDQSTFAGLGPESTGLIQGGLSGPMADVASGAWLSGGNPHFEDALQRSLTDARTGIDSSFAGSGSYGGLSHQKALADTLGGQSLNARAGQFENEYARMGNAQSNQLTLANMLDQNRQGQLTGNYDLWNRQTNAPLSHIANWLNLFQGGQQSNAFPERTNPLANLLGLGAGFAGAFL